jgi:hypothetical protein
MVGHEAIYAGKTKTVVEGPIKKIGSFLDLAADRQQWRQLVGEAKNLLRYEWPRR